MNLVRAVQSVPAEQCLGEAAEEQPGLVPQSSELLFPGTGRVEHGPLCSSPALCSAVTQVLTALRVQGWGTE